MRNIFMLKKQKNIKIIKYLICFHTFASIKKEEKFVLIATS